jgi:hypothetical protein
MKVRLVLWLLLLLPSFPPATHSQVLSGDSKFSALDGVGWGMSWGEIRSLYEKKQKLLAATDSTLTLNTEFFGVAAPTEIRFQQTSRSPSFIHIKFNEASNVLVDTVRNHFTQLTRTAPATTATEKKLFLISLRMEIAKWKTEKESIVLTTASRDGVIGDVGLIISRLAD